MMVMQSLAEQISDYLSLDPKEADEASFDALALALFKYQFENNRPFQRLCSAEKASPETIQRWQDIPAVPASAFKQFELTCAPLTDIIASFHSSGTTGENTSRHLLDANALSLYETSLRRGFHLALPMHPSLIWALMPSSDAAPHSSLSYMLSALHAARFFWNDLSDLVVALRALDHPITLFGTAFAFIHLFDYTPERWSLAPGSIVVETGGFKGRSREVPRDELYQMFQRRFGVKEHDCFSEYGMCEMTSQFYGQGHDLVKRSPHWVRTRAIDPATGFDVPPGQPGLLRHYDLANFNSVICLQTLDYGSLMEDGFLLYGRAPDAELRGCSLRVEELWDE